MLSPITLITIFYTRFKVFFALLLIFGLNHSLYSQGSNAPLDPTYYHLLDRLEITQGNFTTDFYTSYKPYRRYSIGRYVDTLYNQVSQYGSRQDQYNIQFLANDNQEWSRYEKVDRKPILGVFYRTTPDLYAVKTRNFDLNIKPVISLNLGYENGEAPKPYQNTRGAEIRATIDNKVSFYTFLSENQVRYPGYIRSRITEYGTVEGGTAYNNVVPGQAFWKDFKEDGVDFFTARAHVSVNPTESINVQIGHENFFIGNGIRSMVLSDYGPAYPYIKLQTKVWRFQYTNLFAQMRGRVPASAGGSQGSVSIPKKFFALHHLSLNITKNLNIGVFEAIVSGDSVSNGIEVDYFNPVIFYRAIEQYGGSQDNAMVGLDAKWNAWNKFQFYGQFVLDEFLLSAYQEGNGWWANKWALQLGGKYINMFGINNLDGQLEWNRVRPFMYTHQDQYTSYTNYAQPLAHPLGANFNEYIGNIRWQATPRLWVEGNLLYATYGRSPEGKNFGDNVIESYNTRTLDNGNQIGQGIGNTLTSVQGGVSYMLAHRLWLEVTGTARQQKIESSDDKNSLIIQGGVRYNLGANRFLW